MRVLAVDPGYERLGIAVLDNADKKETLVFSECFKTSARLPHSERLKLIGEEMEKIIIAYNPKVFATETLFFNKNQTTAMAVSEARGTIISRAAVRGLPVFEYTPLQIKIAVTGYGRSDKGQVIRMVTKLLPSASFAKIKYDDEYDAIAVGLTFFASYKNPKEKLSWR